MDSHPLRRDGGELRAALARFPTLLEDYSNDEERRTRDLVNERLRPALNTAGNIIAAEIVSWDFHEATLRRGPRTAGSARPR